MTARRRSRPSSSSAPASPRGRPASCSSRPSRGRSAATPSSGSGRVRCCAGPTASSPSGGARRQDGEPERSEPRPIPTRPPPSAWPLPPAPVDGLPPFAGGAVGFFGYDLVRTVEPLGEPNPDPLGLPDMALMITDLLVVFDHLRHELTIMACAFVDEDGGVDAAYERAAATIAEVPRAAARRRRRVPARPSVAEPPRVHVEHGARGVRSRGRADRRVRPRRRRLPGRPLAALLGARPGRSLLGLSRAAGGQPVPLHVLPRVRRLPDRRRLAGAAGQGQRPPGRDPADRRHLPARAQRGGGPPPRRAARQRPQGAGRARDAGRPRPQRPRPGLRVRLGQRSTS